MSFFNDFFAGGMPSGHHFHGHGHGHGHDDSDEEPVDTEKFYQLLDIPKDASQQDIKKAYRKKAKTLHPDRHPQEHEKYQHLFQEVQAAHEVLSDPQKRGLYDKFGLKGVKRGGGGGGGRGGSIFEQMFGGRQQQAQGGAKKSPPIKTALDVTMNDIYNGAQKTIKITRRVAAKDTSACQRCHGQGQITQMQRMGPMVLQQRRECPECSGIGYQLQREQHEIEMHVPIGGRHGESVTIQGEGHQYPDHAAGDVVLQLRVRKHKRFERKGADLGMTYTLSLRQALCGYKIKMEHVSGKTLCITPTDPEEIVQPGSLKVVHTMGLPQRFSPHVKGHLYIVMEVEMPLCGSLSADVIAQFDKMLPAQKIEEDEEEGGLEGDGEERKSNQSKPAPQRKNSGRRGGNRRNGRGRGKGGKGKKGKKGGNNKKNNKKGVFGGLHGHFGGDAGGGKQGEPMEEDEEEEEYIEDVECHTVEGNPKATPAAAGNYRNQDDDEDGDGMSCRQM